MWNSLAAESVVHWPPASNLRPVVGLARDADHSGGFSLYFEAICYCYSIVSLRFVLASSSRILSNSMARTVPGASPSVIEDALDRAQRHREIGLTRRSVDDIGFLSCNRGSLGLSAYHIHEVLFGMIHLRNGWL